MTEKDLIFNCFNCRKETAIVVNVPKHSAARSKTTTIVRYCEHCDTPNKLTLPDNWDVHVFILGRDKEFLGYRDDVPIIQGEKDI